MKKSHLIVIITLSVLVIYYFFGNIGLKLVNYPPKNFTIVAFGDSLVEGYGASTGKDFVSILSQKIGRPIINKGIAGNTTQEGLARIDEVLFYNPGTVFVLFGGNDYLRNMSKEETFTNLRLMITKLQSKGVFVVLLGVRGGAIRDNYESSFEKLAEEMGTAYVPDVLDGIIGDSRYLSDVVHPNDLGYAKIAEKIYNKVGVYLK